MNHLLDTDEDLRTAARSNPEREISLGASTILGIFFALALGAAAVFGLGYTLGRKSAQAAAIAPDPTSAATVLNSPKPAAGSQAPAPANSQPATDTTADATPAGDTPQPTTNNPQPATAVTVPLTPPGNAVTPADAMIAGDKIPQPASQPTTSNQQPATFMVQVAAVSSQDVADILLASLQKKGYSVAARHEPQDNLLHVQIGPFARRADAEAMRQRVLADGFNAIVK
jgi:cell division protein FtsN